MLKQPDYLGDVGRIPRLVCVAAVGFFAVLFSLMTFVNSIGTVILAVTGQWDLIPIVAGSVAGTGLFGAGLIWVLRRLVRPRTSPGGVAVFPLWFIQAVGVILLPAAIMGCVQAIANAENVRMIPLVLGPPVAMILVPWLVRRRQSTARSGSLAS